MVSNFLPSDPRTYLREELRVRKERRPHYSMRAFARDLEMSPSALSEFLSGQVGLSRDRAIWIGRKLKLSDMQVEHFWDLIEAEFGRSDRDRKAAQVRAATRSQSDESRLSLDRFRLIADWYHMPLLELIGLPRKNFSTHELAQILQVDDEHVQAGLDRMVALGLVERQVQDSGVKYRPVHTATITGGEGSNRAIQIAHQQSLEMQSAAVDRKALSDRESLSISLTIGNADWNKFREELRQAVLNVATRFASQESGKDQVVSLSLQAITLLPTDVLTAIHFQKMENEQ